MVLRASACVRAHRSHHDGRDPDGRGAAGPLTRGGRGRDTRSPASRSGRRVARPVTGPAILLDRDGVLNEKAPDCDYITSWSRFEWLPGAREALQLLKQAGFPVIIITNQAGIARGLMTEADLRDIHERMQSALAEQDASVDAIYYCL